MNFEFSTERRRFLKLAGLAAASAALPKPAWPLAPSSRNRIYVVSDIHIGDDSPTCWYQKRYHEPFLLRILDEVIAHRDEVRELVLLGDVVDFWTYAPDVRPPTFETIAAANPNVFGPRGKLVEVLRALEGRVTVLQGNHDLGFTQRDWDAIRTPEGAVPRLVGDLHLPLGEADPRLVLAHGHLYTMFNAPDPSTPFAPLPVGHYVTRAVAHKVRNEIAGTTRTAADLAGQGAPNGMDISSAFVSIAENLPAVASTSPDVVTLMLDMVRDTCGMKDDTPIILPGGRESSLREAKTRYHGLWERWKRAGGGGYAGGTLALKALRADAQAKYLGWFAQKLAIERGAELVVMGHTHFPIQGLVNEAGGGRAACNYLNTGFGCRSEPDASARNVTYAVIDAGTMEGQTYKVSRASQSAGDRYDIERDTSGADSIVYSPFLDYSTYVQVDNARGADDLVRTGVTADRGVYVVPPPERIRARSSAWFWIQDETGVHGSGGSVTYGAGAATLKLDFGCPTGVMANHARARGARVFAKARGEGDWGAEGDVPRMGHPLFVRFVV